MKRIFTTGLFSVAVTLVISPDVWACPSCYGAAEGPMIDGMNMAVMAMLGITGVVLAAIGAFFLMMRRRIKQLRSGMTPGGDHPYIDQQGTLQWNIF